MSLGDKFLEFKRDLRRRALVKVAALNYHDKEIMPFDVEFYDGNLS